MAPCAVRFGDGTMTHVVHLAPARSLLDQAIAWSRESSLGEVENAPATPGTVPGWSLRGQDLGAAGRRDLLLASWMRLPFDRTPAIRVLRARAGGLSRLARASGRRGASVQEVDVATEALVVMLAAELLRWGTPWEDVAKTLPEVNRALERITHGDRDRDGFVERSDGSAWAEDQGYAYAAYRARATLARASGNPDQARCWEDAAQAIRHHFNQAFWLPESGRFANALDATSTPTTVAGAEIGQCLWTEVIDEDKAGVVAAHLMAHETFCRWGLRSRKDPAEDDDDGGQLRVINPSENAIVAAGLARYGYRAEAFSVAQTQFAAADSFGGLLPGSFMADPRIVTDGAAAAGRRWFGDPVAVRRCAPQECAAPHPPTASSAAAPLLLLRALLGLEPDVPRGTVQLSPAVPARYLPLVVEDLLVGGERATVRLPAAARDPIAVSGLPDGVSLTLAGPAGHRLSLERQTVTSHLARRAGSPVTRLASDN